jgi:hypothetical protein
LKEGKHWKKKKKKKGRRKEKRKTNRSSTRDTTLRCVFARPADKATVSGSEFTKSYYKYY